MPLPIYTIGYGAHEIDAFIAVLKFHNISWLMDIRSRPYSRYKPGFSRQTLAEHLQAQGVRYAFLEDTPGEQPGQLITRQPVTAI